MLGIQFSVLNVVIKVGIGTTRKWTAYLSATVYSTHGAMEFM